MDEVGIETERMWLIPVSQAHFDHHFRLDRDPEVKRFIDGGRPPVAAAVRASIDRAIGSRWSAFDKRGGAFLGWFAATPTDIGERELGYRLARDAWGRGLATEGALTIVDHAFSDRATELVWAQTMTVNTGSRRVLEKCGLRFVRTFFLEWEDPIPGSAHGDVRYELTRSSWEATRTPR